MQVKNGVLFSGVMHSHTYRQAIWKIKFYTLRMECTNILRSDDRNGKYIRYF